MTEDIKNKLEKELDEINYSRKKERGCILLEEDIKFIFNILKSYDKEINPIFTIFEKIILENLNNNYILVEKSIKELFKFYNILENNDLINSRHKFFFTENKKLIKKQFFNKISLEKIKTEFEINNIFKKIL